VAVLRDFDNEANERRINTYTKDAGGDGEFWRWINHASRRHLSADFVWPHSDFEGYRLLIAPHIKIVDPALVSRLTQFVEAGGTLVLTAQSGSKDRNCHLFELPLPGPLRELAGVEVEDWTTLAKKETRDVELTGGKSIALDVFVERLKPISAKAIGTWQTDDSLLAGAPAVTVNQMGRGSVYYIGGYCPTAAVDSLLEHLQKKLKLSPLVQAEPEVEAIDRVSGRDRYVVLMNHSTSSRRVRGLSGGRELIHDRPVPAKGLVLEPYEVAVVSLPAVAVAAGS